MWKAVLFRDYRQTVKSPIMIAGLALYAIIGYVEEMVFAGIRLDLNTLIFIYSVLAFGSAGILTDLISLDSKYGVFNILHQVDNGFVKYFFSKMVLPIIITAVLSVGVWLIYIPYGLGHGFHWGDLVVSTVVAECQTAAITALGLVVISWGGAQLQLAVTIGNLAILTVIDVVVMCYSAFAAVALSVAFVLAALLILNHYIQRRYVNTLR